MGDGRAMNRRGFIGTLLASVAGLALDPKTLLWRPTVDAPLAAPEALLTLNQITMALARELAPLVGTGRLVTGHVIGHRGCEHQLSIHMRVPETMDTEGLPPMVVKDVARTLLDQIRQHDVRRFGQLRIPDPLAWYGHGTVVASRKHGFAIRGLYQPVFFPPDVGSDPEPILRFDVLGGA